MLYNTFAAFYRAFLYKVVQSSIDYYSISIVGREWVNIIIIIIIALQYTHQLHTRITKMIL